MLSSVILSNDARLSRPINTVLYKMALLFNSSGSNMSEVLFIRRLRLCASETQKNTWYHTMLVVGAYVDASREDTGKF